MCDAKKAAEASEDPQSREHQIYRKYMFHASITILHELAHVFVSWYHNGEVDTPPDIYGYLEPKDKSMGESGHFLETEVFGGEMMIYRDPDEGDIQVNSYSLNFPKVLMSNLIHI